MSNTIDQNGHADLLPPGVPLSGAGDAPKPPSTAVDLAAWARGDREYPFTEVVQAIDDLIFDQLYEQIAARRGIVKDRAAAVDFIVEEGLIEPAEARTDV